MSFRSALQHMSRYTNPSDITEKPERTHHEQLHSTCRLPEPM